MTVKPKRPCRKCKEPLHGNNLGDYCRHCRTDMSKAAHAKASPGPQQKATTATSLSEPIVEQPLPSAGGLGLKGTDLGRATALELAELLKGIRAELQRRKDELELALKEIS